MGKAKPQSLIKIVSGGQTGADRAALDWAIKNGFKEKRIRMLNVAGPRASDEPAIACFVDQVLSEALTG